MRKAFFVDGTLLDANKAPALGRITWLPQRYLLVEAESSPTWVECARDEGQAVVIKWVQEERSVYFTDYAYLSERWTPDLSKAKHFENENDALLVVRALSVTQRGNVSFAYVRQASEEVVLRTIPVSEIAALEMWKGIDASRGKHEADT